MSYILQTLLNQNRLSFILNMNMASSFWHNMPISLWVCKRQSEMKVSFSQTPAGGESVLAYEWQTVGLNPLVFQLGHRSAPTSQRGAPDGDSESLIAFPNDRYASIRPTERSRKYRLEQCSPLLTYCLA